MSEPSTSIYNENLYRGTDDLLQAPCSFCKRGNGEECLGPTLEDSGPFFHLARFESLGFSPDDMDGGRMALLCPSNFWCDEWYDGKCKLSKCKTLSEETVNACRLEARWRRELARQVMSSGRHEGEFVVRDPNTGRRARFRLTVRRGDELEVFLYDDPGPEES